MKKAMKWRAIPKRGNKGEGSVSGDRAVSNDGCYVLGSAAFILISA